MPRSRQKQNPGHAESPPQFVLRERLLVRPNHVFMLHLVRGWRRALASMLGLLGLAQLVTMVLLYVVARVRRQRRPLQGFPRTRFDPVHIEGNEVQLYCYGEYLFEDMLAAIDRATDSILLETYIWKGDRLGHAFKKRLIAKAAQGVRVYVIIDSFANLVVPASFKRFPRSVRVLWYGAADRPWHLVDPRNLARDHRKLLVVDGQVAFLGGYNIGDEFALHWRDTHVRVQGPEAARLGQLFIDFWNRHSRVGRHITWTLRRGIQPRIIHRTNDARRLLFPIRDMYVDAIDRSEKRVLITNAYFIPDATMRSALVSAARRGVDVQILIPWTSNHVTADWLGRGFYTQLLEHGIRIFLYQHAMNHAKTMTVDGVWSTVGTANLDRLSQLGNYEVNLEFFDQCFAAQMEQLFTIDKTNTLELTLEWWHTRPWYAKIGERVIAPLRPLF
jgi:cardiolipin synthase